MEWNARTVTLNKEILNKEKEKRKGRKEKEIKL